MDDIIDDSYVVVLHTFELIRLDFTLPMTSFIHCLIIIEGWVKNYL